MPGPVPKRSENRRRRNKPADGLKVVHAQGQKTVKIPPVRAKWHPMMKQWYQSLKTSGQAQFYQDSDWATAVMWCHVMSEHLATGEPVKAAVMEAFTKAAGSLMTTEGERRRLRVELTAAEAPAEDHATLSVISGYKDLLA